MYWSASRFLSGKKTDHGLFVAKFHWRVQERSEWNDIHFDMVIKKVKTRKASGLNDTCAELYKYSGWAREKLRNLLCQIWETGEFPIDLLIGVATA